MLTGAGLTLWRGPNCLFEDLSFAVGPGTALLIRGPNGAGKTTLLRVIAGLTSPEAGSIQWHGRPLTPAGSGPLVAYAGHATALKPDLSIHENLEFFACLAGFARTALADVIAVAGLTHCADVEVRYLSAGQKRRAALARVLMSRSPIWLLDEPQTNLDIDGRGFLEKSLQEHLAGGGLAVIAAHQSLDLGRGPVVELLLGDGG